MVKYASSTDFEGVYSRFTCVQSSRFRNPPTLFDRVILSIDAFQAIIPSWILYETIETVANVTHTYHATFTTDFVYVYPSGGRSAMHELILS